MRKGLVSLVVALVATLFTACGGGGSSESSSTNEIKLSEDKLGYELTAAFSDKSFVQRGVIVPRVAEYYSGTLLAVNQDSNEQTTFSWSATVDDETFEVTSYRTVVLEAGIYDFTLNLSNDDSSKRYIAEKTVTITDSNQTALSFSLKPVLGDLIVDINVSNEIPRLQLEYKDVSDITDENLTLLADIDGENYTLTINPDTGLSDMYLTLSNGEHNLTLELIDDDGIVLAKKELIDANLSEGSSVYEDLNIDLEPLYGEAMLDLNVTTSSLSLIINIPSAVIDEVGGVENLSTLLTYTENNNTSEKEITDINTSGSDYVASVDLENIEKGSFSFSLDFKDSSDGNALIGVCSVESFNLLESNVTKSCDLILIKRALSKSGDLLVNVGVNVFDENNLPVVGAEVYLNDEKVGETGSGFGTEGYLNFTHKKGEYTLKATKDNKEGMLDVNLTALGVKNYELFFSKTILADVNYSNTTFYSVHAASGNLDLNSIETSIGSLPQAIGSSNILKVGSKFYQFGGRDSSGDLSSKIFESDETDITFWTDTGNELNDNIGLFGNMAIIGEYIYGFGGRKGIGTFVSTISRAPLKQPWNWSAVGDLPMKHSLGKLVVIDDMMYIYGGYNGDKSKTTDKIMQASINQPLDWNISENTLPTTNRNYGIAVIGEKIFMYGGRHGELMKRHSKIYMADLAKPTQFELNESSLPNSIGMSNLEVIIIGEKMYMFGGITSDSNMYRTTIYEANISKPDIWYDTNLIVSSSGGYSEAIINGNYLYIIGGYSGGFLGEISKIEIK